MASTNLIILPAKIFNLKRNPLVIFLLAIFALIDGYLLSAISFIGRAGITLFYTQYQFLKTWWKGALLVFIVWVLLLFLQSLIAKKGRQATSKIVQVILLLIAIAGLYFSYSDFRHSLSHRWLGERFHLGVYLFWLGWMGISIYVLLKKNLGKKQEF